MPPLLEQLQSILADLPQILSRGLLAALLLLLAFLLSTWLSRAVASAARRRQVEPSVGHILQRLTRWSILVLGAVLAAEQVIPNVTSLLAGLGIAGFTLGFALQDVAKNLIAGVLLLLQSPFEIGDTIEVTGFTGTVEDITLRATDMRTLDGRFVTIPNADVFINPITNYSRAPSRRLEVAVGLGYASDLDEAAALVGSAIRSTEGYLPEPEPEVFFRSMGPTSVELVALYWADMEAVTYNQALDSGVREVKSTLQRAGFELSPGPVILQGGQEE